MNKSITKEEFIDIVVNDILYQGFNIDYWDGEDLFWDRIDNNTIYWYELGNFPEECVGKEYGDKITKTDIKNFLKMFKENEEEIRKIVAEAITPNNLHNTWDKYWQPQ